MQYGVGEDNHFLRFRFYNPIIDEFGKEYE